jgi:deoxyribodipyrimidine photo-lyase
VAGGGRRRGAGAQRVSAVLLWLRRDLRVADHPALHAALEVGRVVPVFCFDERLLHGRHASGPRTAFLLQCLDDLDRSLRERGSALVVRRGDPSAELVRLARDTAAEHVHASEDAGPFARDRDAAVAAALADAGVKLHLHPGTTVLDDVAAPATKAGRPYTVFTPFHRAWLRQPRRVVLPAPGALPALPDGLEQHALPSLHELGLTSGVPDALPGGEHEARERLARFVADGVHDYDEHRDLPAVDGTSRLSPYLHLGCVSAREVEALLPEGAGPDAFARQLCWRDFHHHVLRHFPGNAVSEFQERYRGTLDFTAADDHFAAWCAGRTGYPLVDAGMRQLLTEGWMHNRVRLVVGSFLTKQLGIDWRRGERHFMARLIDGDEASNNGNWQWIASVGVDPAPAFRRMYNPTLQQRRMDPGGVYVRRHVPELRAVEDRYLAEPWTMPAGAQRTAGCVIGADYPGPIVDHGAARRQALERYRGPAATT